MAQGNLMIFDKKLQTKAMNLNYKNTYYLLGIDVALGLAAGYAPLDAQTRGLFLILSLVLLAFLALRAFAIVILRGPQVPIVPLGLGIFLVAGGTAADVWATLAHSPNLAREANPLARLMLELELSLNLVLGIGFASQLFLALLCISLYVQFLRESPQILQSMTYRGHLTFFTEVYGGPGANWRDLLLNRVSPRHQLIFLAPLLVLLYSYRWYLALEWIEVVPISRIVVPLVLLVVSVLGLHFIYIRQSSRHQSTGSGR